MDKIHGTIQSVAFGGEGILRNNSFVVFVPFTAPGDEVEIELIKKKKRHGFGKVLNLIQSSPLRTLPKCPYFGTCGGCQFQHLNYSAQLDIKRQFIQDALERIALAKVDIPPIIPADTTWAYRQHIRLNVKLPSHQAGYIGYDNATFVDVTQCPIFDEPKHSVLADLKIFLSQFQLDTDQEAHVRIFKDHKSYLLSFSFLSSIPQPLSQLDQSVLKQFPNWKGILFSSPHEKIALGNTDCFMEILGLKLQYSPFGFIQNHPEQCKKLYEYTLRQVPNSCKNALDLYCGIGATTLLLTHKGIKTMGVESHTDTVNLAKKNAQENNISDATFHCGKAEALLEKLIRQMPLDCVLLNPPRTGVDPKITELLIQASIPLIIYTSCMPSTLARDIGLLLKNGYQIESIQGFDMFPQTTHVETVVTLRMPKKFES